VGPRPGFEPGFTGSIGRAGSVNRAQAGVLTPTLPGHENCDVGVIAFTHAARARFYGEVLSFCEPVFTTDLYVQHERGQRGERLLRYLCKN